MTENEKKPEVQTVAEIIAFADFVGSRYTTQVRPITGALEKASVSLPVPTTDDEARRFYNVELSALIEAGVKNFSTKPDWATAWSLEFDVDSEGKPTTKKIGFVPGSCNPDELLALAEGMDMAPKEKATTTASARVKAKASQFDQYEAMAKAAGYDSLEAFMAAQAGGGQD